MTGISRPMRSNGSSDFLGERTPHFSCTSCSKPFAAWPLKTLFAVLTNVDGRTIFASANLAPPPQDFALASDRRQKLEDLATMESRAEELLATARERIASGRFIAGSLDQVVARRHTEPGHSCRQAR